MIPRSDFIAIVLEYIAALLVTLIFFVLVAAFVEWIVYLTTGKTISKRVLDRLLK